MLIYLDFLSHDIVGMEGLKLVAWNYKFCNKLLHDGRGGCQGIVLLLNYLLIKFNYCQIVMLSCDHNKYHNDSCL